MKLKSVIRHNRPHQRGDAFSQHLFNTLTTQITIITRLKIIEFFQMFATFLEHFFSH